uniref:Uncharacterized protein n=1 Tax=uncultured Nitrospirae bacterium MY3-11A TaxID=798579 RepID=D9MP57_9BACT|nr:hypothetical protein LW4_0110 [uncultured Nitrospirae bacterium MY3-11A]
METRGTALCNCPRVSHLIKVIGTVVITSLNSQSVYLHLRLKASCLPTQGLLMQFNLCEYIVPQMIISHVS